MLSITELPSQLQVSLETDLIGADNQTDITGGAQLPQCHLFKIWFYGVFTGIFCLLGIIGNTVSSCILRQDSSLMPAVSVQLHSLGITDNVFLILWIIHYVIRYVIVVFRFEIIELLKIFFQNTSFIKNEFSSVP